MISKPKRFAGLAAAVLAAGALAACSSSSTSSPASPAAQHGDTGVRRDAAHRLRLGPRPPRHRALVLHRGLPAHARLRPGSSCRTRPCRIPVSRVPAGWRTPRRPRTWRPRCRRVANGGITNGGKTYTFHIKPGVDWNTSPPRQVTSQDFLREFKAFFNPVSPVGNPVYYESTIAGLTAYANAETAYFTNKSNAPTAANIANFQNTHTISGITTPNSSTIQFTLISPASDFLYMLAMPFASARPVEYDSYVPNSLQLDQHTICRRTVPDQLVHPRQVDLTWSRTRPGSSPPTRSGTSMWTRSWTRSG